MHKVEDLNEQIQAEIKVNLDPAWVRWGLKTITGLMIDDQEATPELLISDGPSELFGEIAEVIKQTASMTEDQLKNFAWPSISGAQTDGTNLNTSAPNANDGDTSAVEIASDSSQS